MTLKMTNQACQQLQQKMSLGSIEEKTIVKIANPFGSPKTLKQFIYMNRLYKYNFHPSHSSLHSI